MRKTLGPRLLFKGLISDPTILPQLIGDSEEIISVKIPFSNTIHVITRPSDIKHCFYDKASNYIRDASVIKGVRDVLEGGIDVSVDNLAQDSKIIMELFSAEKQRMFAESIIESLDETLGTWNKFTEQRNDFYVEQELTILFTHVYLNVLLGGAKLNNVPEVAALINSLFYTFFPKYYYLQILGKIPGPFTRKYQLYHENKAATSKLGRQILESALSAMPDRFNLIKSLAKQYNYPESLADMTETMKQHLSGRGFATLVSGTHNMVGTLTHILVRLSLNPEITKVIRDEINTVLGDRTPCYEDYEKLVYTRGVFLEMLRIQPALLNIFRVALEDDFVSGALIKKGDNIIIPALVTHKRQKYWDNPEGFEPERFVKGLTPQQKLLYLGFSNGPQSCVAKQYSCIQAVFFLVLLLRRFNLVLPPNSSLHYDKDLLFFAQRLNTNVRMSVEKVKP